MKLRKRYEVTKKIRSYEKDTKKVRSYEKRYEDVTKGFGYEATKLRDSNATYRDNLL